MEEKLRRNFTMLQFRRATPGSCLAASLPGVRRLIASCFGLGLIPRLLWKSDSGAGTFGAAFGAGIGGLILATHAGWWVGAAAAAVAIGLSVWSARPFAKGNLDPGWVCMDETAGTLVALVGLSGWPWLAAVLLARAADIWKVLPGVRRAERLPGSLGVVADDVAAGLYGLALGWALKLAGI
jgi:phosphatidylglycerophosphatase A